MRQYKSTSHAVDFHHCSCIADTWHVYQLRVLKLRTQKTETKSEKLATCQPCSLLWLHRLDFSLAFQPQCFRRRPWRRHGRHRRLRALLPAGSSHLAAGSCGWVGCEQRFVKQAVVLRRLRGDFRRAIRITSVHEHNLLIYHTNISMYSHTAMSNTRPIPIINPQQWFYNTHEQVIIYIIYNLLTQSTLPSLNALTASVYSPNRRRLRLSPTSECTWSLETHCYLATQWHWH